MPSLATVASYGFADIPTAAMLRVFRELGCRTCQYYRNEQNPPVAAEARRLAESEGLPIDSIHGVFGPNYDPSSPEGSVRRLAVEVYRREGELSLELGGPRVVVHPSPAVPRDAQVGDAERSARWSALGRSVDELGEIGRELGVVYLIENVPPTSYVGSDVAALAALIRGRAHPNLSMCFDTGHAHLCGDAADQLRACLDVTTYVHVSDNDGRADQHAIPGHGSIDWQRLRHPMAELPGDVPAMLELFQSEAEFRARMADGLADRLRHWLAV